MPLNVHYCCDILVGLSIAQQSNDDIDCCGEDANCCSDQEVKIDVANDYLPSGAKQNVADTDMVLVPLYKLHDFSLNGKPLSLNLFSGYLPPETIEYVSLQVRHCTFLI